MPAATTFHLLCRGLSLAKAPRMGNFLARDMTSRSKVHALADAAEASIADQARHQEN